MAMGITSRFNAYKRQGLTDSDAMQRAMNDQAADIAKLRKADAVTKKKRKGSRTSRLKKGIKTLLSGPGHSPAGKRYLRSR
ncbi:hypothetical protein KAR91_43795 [Candidatus Pacearchaeota archaeon]|nr:hypothetical protein [Candidatus Pacearchaeota archaeon]